MKNICFCGDDTCVYNVDGTCETDCKHEIKIFDKDCYNVCVSYEPTEQYKKELGDADAD